MHAEELLFMFPRSFNLVHQGGWHQGHFKK